MTDDELNSLDQFTIPSRIRNNEKLIREMVGWLYPAILREENQRLRERYYQITGHEYGTTN